MVRLRRLFSWLDNADAMWRVSMPETERISLMMLSSGVLWGHSLEFLSVSLYVALGVIDLLLDDIMGCVG